MKNFTLLVLTIICLVFASCEIINPDESIPSYIYLDAPELEIAGTQETVLVGKSETGIAAYHLLINNQQSLGVYEHGSSDTVPILNEGLVNISIQPFIWKNGISTTPVPSPFHTFYNIEGINLSTEQIVAIIPRFEYLEEFYTESVPFVDNFNSSLNFEITDILSAIPYPEATEVFEGTKSMAVRLDEARNFFHIQNNQAFNLSKFASDVYLELMYKCDANFTIRLGVCCNGSSGYAVDAINVSKKDYWNRIFIELTDEVIAAEFSEEKVFTIQLYGELPEEETEAYFYFDNIRVLERED